MIDAGTSPRHRTGTGDWQFLPGQRATAGADQPQPPTHEAQVLTDGGTQARIVLNGQTYSLRITRSGKLILTK